MQMMIGTDCITATHSLLTVGVCLRAWGEQEPPVPPASLQSDSPPGDRCCAWMFSFRIPNTEHSVEERRGTYPKLVCLNQSLLLFMIYFTIKVKIQKSMHWLAAIVYTVGIITYFPAPNVEKKKKNIIELQWLTCLFSAIHTQSICY